MQFLRTLIASVIGTLVAFGLLFLVGMALAIGIASTSEQAVNVPSSSVLSVKLSGTVPERSVVDPFQRLLSDDRPVDLITFKEALEKATSDERIKTLWLRPQGISEQWATLQEMRTALLAFKESGKEIVAYSGTDGFNEKDYFLASTADRIYAPPEATFEFDGFAVLITFYQNLLDKLDVEPQIVRAGKYKSAIEPFTRSDLSEPNEEQLSALLQTQNQTFLSALAKSRNLSVEQLSFLAEEEGVYLAETAYEAGLIDSLLYEHEIRNHLKAATDQDLEDDLETVSLANYNQVSPVDAGLETGGPNNIAVVYAQGAITSGESQDPPPNPVQSQVLGSDTFVEAMDEATEDESIKAVVVRVNSPGGSVTASDVMWRSVVRATEEKPVIFSMGNVAASGGYYIAAPSDSIVADPLTITGSIGVFGLFFDVSGLFENKLGITFDQVKTSPFADAFSGLRSFTPEERAKYEDVIDQMYQEFLGKVAQGRGLTIEQVHEIAQGRVWTGVQAQEVGLVDELGTLEDAVEIAAEKAGLAQGEYDTEILPRPKPFVERLAQSLRRQVSSWSQQWNLGPGDQTLLQHVKTLQQLENAHGTPQARLPYELNIK